MPVPIYHVSRALGSYLTDLYGARNAGDHVANPWVLVGIGPNEAGAIADQMVSGGNYFTCYASAFTNLILSTEDDGQRPRPQEEVDLLRKLYAKILGGAKRRPARGRNQAQPQEEGADPSERRDTTGRLRLSEKKQRWVREQFYKEWVYPPIAQEVEDYLMSVLGESQQSRFAKIAEGVIERALGELRFYRDLRKSVNALSDDGSRERRLLEDYRTLLPLWVYTQRTHASEDDPGLLLNLYDLDFWSYDPGEGEAPLERLVDELCGCFIDDGALAGEARVEEFRFRAEDLFRRCVDEAEMADRAFETGRRTESSTIEHLFQRSRETGRAVVPAWAQHRAELIWLIMVSSCVGLEAALGPSDRATADDLIVSDQRLDDDCLGRGSGAVPLSVRVGRRDVGSFDLRLADDAPDGLVVCVLGRERDPRFWTSWADRAKELLGMFFQPETHLDEKDPDGLPARLKAAIGSRFDASTREGRTALKEFARLEAIAAGQLDTARELRDASLRALDDCLRLSFCVDADSAEGPVLDLGTNGRCAEGTLVGAARRAAEELNELLTSLLRAQREDEYARAVAGDVRGPDGRALDEDEARKRRDARMPSVRARASSLLEGVLTTYFNDQRFLCDRDGDPVAGNRSKIDLLLDRLEDEYGERHGRDPSMRLAVTRLRRVLVPVMSPSRVKTLSLRKMRACVDEVFSSFDEAEKSCFVALPSADVSARHAVAYLRDGRLTLVDAGSLQGTAALRQEREGGGGIVLVRESALVLEGTERRLDKMLDATWMPQERVEVPEVVLRRGDVIRLAGQVAVGVGGAL